MSKEKLSFGKSNINYVQKVVVLLNRSLDKTECCIAQSHLSVMAMLFDVGNMSSPLIQG